MKFLVGDKVKITAGKDKGKTGTISRVFPKKDKVIVEGLNLYTKHRRKTEGRSGERVQLARPLPTAKIAIINDKDQVDRIGYKAGENGQKVRIFKKTGQVIGSSQPAAKTKKDSKQSEKSSKKSKSSKK